MKAIWKDTIVAESAETVVVEGNHYFPADSIVEEYFSKSDTATFCSWKGTANYYTLVMGDDSNRDAAWYYPDPKEEAQNIKGYVAFWKGVEVVE